MADQVLMGEELSDESQWEEEWEVIMQTKGKYTLSKNQAILVKEAMANNSRSVVFDTFAIPIPYVAEFYRVKRFRIGQKALPSRATEPEYVPMSPERMAEFRKKAYAAIGKTMPKK